MADDGDEDVVFENSALYEHLQNVGFDSEDIRPEQVRPQHSEMSEHRRGGGGGREPNLARAFLRHLHASCLTWLGLGDEWIQQQREMDREWGGEVCKVALSKDALEPEDADFLQNISQVQRNEDNNRDSTEPRNSRYGLERLLSVGVGVTAYTTARLFYPRATAMTFTYDWIVGLFGILLLLPPSIRLLRTAAHRRRHRCALQAMAAASSAAERWRRAARRSVRLIQEMELVARGFTLVSGVAAADRLECGRLLEARRQCPELRRLLLLTGRDVTIYMRNATNDLILAWPLGAEMETMHLCQVPLDDYGSIMTETDEEKLSSITDNYSLTNIKAVLEICNLQLSEFMKRVVLMCLVSAPVGNLSGTDVLEQYVEPSAAYLLRKAADLQSSYNVHRCSLISEPPDREGQGGEAEDGPKGGHDGQHWQGQQGQHTVSNLYTAVHSLDLHMQAALRRVRRMGDELEVLCNQGDAQLDSDLQKRLSADLSKVRADLDACVDCWDEGILHVTRSARRHAPTAPTSSLSEEASLAKEPHDPIALFEMGDPIVPDQVFEAYTEDTDLESENWGTDEFLSPEEKEKKQREKREALRLLKELKSVIAVRAADWEQREQAARRRMGVASTGPGTPGGDDVEEAGESSPLGENNSCRSRGVAMVKADLNASPHCQVTNSDGSKDYENDEEGNLTDELVDDLHEDLVNLADPGLQEDASIFESLDDDEDDDDIFGCREDYSEDEDYINADPDRVDLGANDCAEADDAQPVQVEVSEVRLAALKARLAEEPGSGVGMAASAVAALAASRSQAMGPMEAQTFGDSESEDEQSEAVDGEDVK